VFCVPVDDHVPAAQLTHTASVVAAHACRRWPGVTQFGVEHAGQTPSSVPLTEKVPEAQVTQAASCAPPHSCLKVPGVEAHEKVDGSVQAVQVPLLLCATAVVDQVPTAQVAQEVSTVVVQATV
jgi:hypothetical protein